MSFKLKRSLISFDLETTGLDVDTDRIVEIGLVKRKVDGTEIKKCFRLNPEKFMTDSAINVHGITNEDIKDCLKFRDVAEALKKFFINCDLIGQNIENYDVPLLSEEFRRCGIDFPFEDTKIVDTYLLESKLFPRDLSTLLKKYTGEVLENAHAADADAQAALTVFECQTEEFEQKEITIEEVEDFIGTSKTRVDFQGWFKLNEGGAIVYARGAHRDKLLTAAPASYIDWFLSATNNYARNQSKRILKNEIDEAIERELARQKSEENEPDRTA